MKLVWVKITLKMILLEHVLKVIKEYCAQIVKLVILRLELNNYAKNAPEK